MRILFDTDELRSLGSIYRSGAGAISSIRTSTASSAAGLSLNLDDPVIRGARIHERQGRLNGQLDRLANGYRQDAGRFAALAGRLEGDQGALPSWLLTMPTWGALGAGAVGAGFVAGGMVRTTGLTALERVSGGLRGLYGTFRVGAAVGRSTIDRGLGLVRRAHDSFRSAAQRFADRLRRMAADAWNAIWGAVTDSFRRVQEGLRQVVQAIAGLRDWVVGTAGRVGRWLVESENWFVRMVVDAAFDVFVLIFALNLYFLFKPLLPWVFSKYVAEGNDGDIGLGIMAWADVENPLVLLMLLSVIAGAGGISSPRDIRGILDPNERPLVGLDEVRGLTRSRGVDAPPDEARLEDMLRRDSLATFLQERSVHTFVASDRFDGCSGVEDSGHGFDFTQACLRHDFLYSRYKELDQQTFQHLKAEIDQRFLNDMNDLCKAQPLPLQPACFARATIYHKGVVYLANAAK